MPFGRTLTNPIALIALALVAIGGIVAGVILLMPSGSSTTPVDETYDEVTVGATSTTTATRTPTPTARSVLAPSSTPIPTPTVFIAPITRLRIPKIEVDAAVQTKGVDASNTMESPDGPVDVAWYNFTAKPGLGAGNAVFSGHLDYINYGKAVFGDLEELVEGDVIEVVLEDGTVVQFSVTAMQSYAVDQVPMGDVLASTSTESVTLITCGGQFSQGAYTHRLVIRATRTGIVPAVS
jgi:LPXTG-site transpeptidase (sortase) family protein